MANIGSEAKMQQVGFLNKYFLKIFICQEFIPYTHSWESQEWAGGGDGGELNNISIIIIEVSREFKCRDNLV